MYVVYIVLNTLTHLSSQYSLQFDIPYIIISNTKDTGTDRYNKNFLNFKIHPKILYSLF